MELSKNLIDASMQIYSILFNIDYIRKYHAIIFQPSHTSVNLIGLNVHIILTDINHNLTFIKHKQILVESYPLAYAALRASLTVVLILTKLSFCPHLYLHPH